MALHPKNRKTPDSSKLTSQILLSSPPHPQTNKPCLHCSIDFCHWPLAPLTPISTTCFGQTQPSPQSPTQLIRTLSLKTFPLLPPPASYSQIQSAPSCQPPPCFPIVCDLDDLLHVLARACMAASSLRIVALALAIGDTRMKLTSSLQGACLQHGHEQAGSHTLIADPVRDCSPRIRHRSPRSFVDV